MVFDRQAAIPVRVKFSENVKVLFLVIAHSVRQSKSDSKIMSLKIIFFNFPEGRQNIAHRAIGRVEVPLVLYQQRENVGVGRKSLNLQDWLLIRDLHVAKKGTDVVLIRFLY